MKNIFILISASALLLSGCYETTFSVPQDTDLDPTSLQLDITVVGTTDDDVIPTDFVGAIEDQTIALKSSNEFELENISVSGTYTGHVHSVLSDDISITNSLSTDNKILVTSTNQYGVANNDYMNLYYGSKDITIVAETSNYAEIEVSKVIKDLTFEFIITGTYADQVESMSATLSGVAQQWELVSNAPSGVSSAIDLPFDTYFSQNNYSSVRLLGIDPSESQIVTATVSFNNDITPAQIVTFDISDKLTDFNDDKSAIHDAITLTIDTSVSNSGSINPWEGETESDEIYGAEQMQ